MTESEDQTWNKLYKESGLDAAVDVVTLEELEAKQRGGAALRAAMLTKSANNLTIFRSID